MSEDTVREIPAYQHMDILLKNHLNAKEPPVRGWAVNCASCGCVAVVEAKLDAEAICDNHTSCKWEPYITREWLHVAEDGRRYRTPR